jgi:hypothetical protein
MFKVDTYKCDMEENKVWDIITFKSSYHKFHGSQFDNNSNVKSTFHRFVWNKHGCHSYICIVWTLMSCALFRHECHMLICIV